MEEQKTTLLIELHYLPCLQFFSELQDCEVLLLEAHESFQKQTYRNRTRILASQKIEQLLIPVHSAHSHLPVRDIRIDQHQKWALSHQRAIRTAYGKSPYFEHFGEEILRLYDKPSAFLFDFNLQALTLCLKLLNLHPKISLTSDYQKDKNKDTVFLRDLRNQIHPKKGSEIHLKSYQQVFGRQFEPNLSIIDLLFCEGNRCNPYLKK